MFSLIFLSVCTLLHSYLCWRLVALFSQHNTPRRRWLTSLAVAVWVLFAASWMGHSQIFPGHHAAEWIWSQWLGILFLLSVPLLLVDGVTLFGCLYRPIRPVLGKSAVVVGIVLCAIALVQGTRPPVISSYEITVDRLPPELDGLSVVALSDLHLGPLLDPPWLSKRLEQVSQLSADMIVFVGDIFEVGEPEADAFIDRLRTLKARYGVWGVSGNHEYYGGNKLSLFAPAGITLLQNRWEVVTPGLIIAGVDDLTIAQRQGRAGVTLVDSALSDRPDGATIFLSHTPWQFDKAVQHQVDIMISGHTHGGQIWPFNYLVAQRYPTLAGHYRDKTSQLFVGRGTGTWGPRMRLWQRAEILHLTLRCPQP
ncbi:MAG: metallophosphoesterase [Desulfuromonas sp.]|nr:MAG: metallophosphoesterase [Desulfuromonas sp.]